MSMLLIGSQIYMVKFSNQASLHCTIYYQWFLNGIFLQPNITKPISFDLVKQIIKNRVLLEKYMLLKNCRYLDFVNNWQTI